jgi:hypothetical protein
MEAMSSVKTRNPRALLHPLTHHAKDLERMVGWLSYGIMTELLPAGWELKQSRNGPNSYSIRKGDTQRHFRSRPPFKVIEVYDRAVGGNLVTTLEGRVSVTRFIESLLE